MNLPPPVVFGLVLAAFTLLHVVAWKAAEKLDRRAKIAAAVVTAALCLPGVWFAFYYLH